MDKKKENATLEDTLIGEMPMIEKPELVSAIEMLDDDKKLNKNTRLTKEERNALLRMEELNDSLKMLSPKIQIAHKFKEMSISLDGKGREEKRDMIIGDRQLKTGNSMGEKFANLFRRREQ